MGRAAHLLDQPEEQVVVLAAVAFGALAPHLLKEGPAEHRQVADVVAAQQVVGGIVGLEVPHQRPADILFKEGLVAVQEAVRLAGGPQVQDGPAHLVHGMGRQHVVMVGQGQVFPVGQGRRRVGVGGNPLILDLFVYDLLILCLIFPHNLSHLAVGAVGSVRQAELAVGGSLVHKGIQEGPQVGRRGVVQGGQDADGGQAAVGPGLARIKSPLGRQDFFVRQVAGFLAEKAALDKARRPLCHGGQALFPGHRHRIAAQLPDAFALLLVHRCRPLISYASPRWVAL